MYEYTHLRVNDIVYVALELLPYFHNVDEGRKVMGSIDSVIDKYISAKSYIPLKSLSKLIVEARVNALINIHESNIMQSALSMERDVLKMYPPVFIRGDVYTYRCLRYRYTASLLKNLFRRAVSLVLSQCTCSSTYIWSISGRMRREILSRIRSHSKSTGMPIQYIDSDTSVSDIIAYITYKGSMIGLMDSTFS